MMLMCLEKTGGTGYLGKCLQYLDGSVTESYDNTIISTGLLKGIVATWSQVDAAIYYC